MRNGGGRVGSHYCYVMREVLRERRIILAPMSNSAVTEGGVLVDCYIRVELGGDCAEREK